MEKMFRPGRAMLAAGKFAGQIPLSWRKNAKVAGKPANVLDKV